MSEVQALLRHYAEVRNRLQRPPNAVPDTGINLRIRKPPPPVVALTQTPEHTSKLSPAQKKRMQTYRDSFCRKDVTMKSILKLVAAELGIDYHRVISRGRSATIVLPRQIAFYLTDKHLKQSLSSMGWYMGMDHTSILHGRNKIRQLIVVNPEFRAKIEAIEAKLLENYPELAVSAKHECDLEVQPGPCSQVRDLLEMDTSGGSAFPDPKEGSDQDVAGAICPPTTAIQETPQIEQ